MPAQITYFDGSGSGDYIMNVHDPAHALLNDMELEVVVMLNRSTSSGPIIGFSAYDAGASESIACNVLYSLRLNGRKVEVFHEFGNGSNYIATSTQDVPFGKWLRIKMIRSGFTYYAYVDGVLHLQATFLSGQRPAMFTPINTQNALRLGLLYTDMQTTTRASRISICYAVVKNESGSVVYSYGQDPGGSPGVAPLDLAFAPPFDPFRGVFERTVQVKKGMDDLDSMYLLVTRGPQRANGYLIDPIDEGSGGGGSDPIQTPRAFPLETQWKRANASQFE